MGGAKYERLTALEKAMTIGNRNGHFHHTEKTIVTGPIVLYNIKARVNDTPRI